MPEPSWPTGPVPVRAPIPQPADLPIPEDDPADAPAVVAGAGCEDPACAECRVVSHVARVGAARICELIGIDFEELPRFQQSHYEHVATEVMAAMSAALIEAQAVVLIGDPS